MLLLNSTSLSFSVWIFHLIPHLPGPVRLLVKNKEQGPFLFNFREIIPLTKKKILANYNVGICFSLYIYINSPIDNNIVDTNWAIYSS